MRVLVYVNKEKDPLNDWLKKIISILKAKNVDHQIISDENLHNNMKGDAIFVLGGDGTILGLTEFSLKNSIPIIGINAGKLGFLTEFEKTDTEEAVDLFLKKELVEDKRNTLKVVFNGKIHYALNDIVIQRMYSKNENGMIVKLSISVDDENADLLEGDGVIIATSTGSTAYSLSAGGAILAPRINAFLITPIAAHSLTHRPIIYSSDSVCTVKALSGKNIGMFFDGKYFGELNVGCEISIYKSGCYTTFLRKKEYNFYKRLSQKLKTENK